MRNRKFRNRDEERTAIRAATHRLLEGIPLRSSSGKLTATELITESGLRRDVVYSHRDLIDDFKARVKATNSTPASLQQLSDRLAALKEELSNTKQQLADERATAEILRKVIAELSLELHQAREELTDLSNVTRLRSTSTADPQA